MTDDVLYCPFCGAEGMRKRAASHNAQSGRARFQCTVRSCQRRTTRPLYVKPQILPRVKVTEIRKSKFFVITSAVNDTAIVHGAHETFRQIAEAHGGSYLIIPTVHKNPDLYHQGVHMAYKWPEEILPYVCNANVDLNNSLRIRGETRIPYTRVNPLTGMNNAGDIKSEIYGHPQVAMELVATPKNDLPKMLHTTGTISRPNYGGSPPAQKAAFHHSLSALIVEVEGDKFWTREVHYNGEGAYDLDRYYTPEGYTEGHRAAAIVYGDTHVRALTKRTEELLDAADELLQPEKRILHDLHDHNVGSHHTRDDVIQHLIKAERGAFSVRDELMLSVRYLEDRPGAYVVDSNHHRHLDQWFNRFDPKRDPVNAPLYFELGELIRNDIAEGGDGNAFRVFVQKYCSARVNFVGANDKFDVRGVDCSQHGDRGPNGSRGSVKAFARSGYKSVTAHGHGPGIEKGACRVGVSAPDLEYAQGYSNWLNTHCSIYQDGKRALFSIIKDKLSPSMRPGYWQKLAQRGAA